MRHAGGVLKNRIMDEEKERPRYHPLSAELRGKQKEVKEKLEDAGLDPDEFDEDESLGGKVAGMAVAKAT